jgi:pyruvate formate lyase activating enzyme
MMQAVLSFFVFYEGHMQHTVSITAFCIAGWLLTTTAYAENFPEWRGARGDGVITSPAADAFPLRWSPTENILWKTPLEFPGNSSPIVYEDRVFLTSANDDGTKRSLICFDRATGRKLWQSDSSYDEPDPTHKTNPWSAASPATDGQTVFTFWSRDLGTITHKWGHASSPRLYKNTVIIHAGPGPNVALYALNKQTGATVWKTEPPFATGTPQALKGSFATPLLWRNGARDELLLPLPGFLVSFDPNTGRELWRCAGLGDLTYSDALVGEGLILAFSGFKGPSIGMRQPAPTETGDLTESHRLWQAPSVYSHVGSAILLDGRFYICDRKGPLHCGDTRTGELVWTHDLREQTWSAITRLGDRLYLTDQAAVTHVFQPGDRFEVITQNAMAPDERTNATIAFSNPHRRAHIMALQNPRAIELKTLLDDMTEPGRFYDTLPDGRLLCYACGHECKIAEGKEGVCRVRSNRGGELYVPTGYVGSLACDPIEKKPFFHAFPSQNALSFGMLGCDFHCGYCQNWITSQVMRDDDAVAPAKRITPLELIDLAIQYNAPVIASTYNEPLITSEWAMKTLEPATERGFIGAYISNGNATERLLEQIRPYVPLYNVDLKSFREKEYLQLGGQLENVKRTIRQLHAMGFWMEVITLVVPGFNDSDEELTEMAHFLVEISPDIPWHLSAFHSDYEMNGTPDTPIERLHSACQIGVDAGLRYVYAGNRPGHCGDWENTRCPSCKSTVINRTGFRVESINLDHGRCPSCATPIPGFWHKGCYVPQENAGLPAYLEANPKANAL